MHSPTVASCCAFYNAGQMGWGIPDPAIMNGTGSIMLTKNVTLNDSNCHYICFLDENSVKSLVFCLGMEDACSR
jgi:hypothetical protein